MLTIGAKKHAKLDITFLKPCSILPHFFTPRHIPPTPRPHPPPPPPPPPPPRTAAGVTIRRIIYSLQIAPSRIRLPHHKTMSEICSNSTRKTAERHVRRSSIFIINFEQISHIVLVFPLLTWNK